MKLYNTSWVEETIDFVEGPTSFQLEDFNTNYNPALFSSQPHFIRARFQSTSYNPSLVGGIIRDGRNLGEAPLARSHLLKGKEHVLDQGLISHVQCIDEDNKILAQWAFDILPPGVSRVTLYENSNTRNDDWHSSLEPFNVSDTNRVFLIPIGAIWKDPRKLETLTQAYAILRSDHGNRTVWHVTTDYDLSEVGIPPPHGWLSGEIILCAHCDNPTPSTVC